MVPDMQLYLRPITFTASRGAEMYRVAEGATIATVTDLRRRTAEVLERAEDGSVVVIQKDNEPQGVYVSFRRYQTITARLDKLESLELAEVASARKAAIDSGKMGTTSLRDMISEFAPDMEIEDVEGG
jgi:prevent-host-death family protein